MKILVVADLHYSLRQYDWLKSVRHEADLLIVAGDLLDLAAAVDLDVQAVVMHNYLSAFSSTRPLLASSGNHDLTGEDGDGEPAAMWLRETGLRGFHTDLQTYHDENLTITICPWWEGGQTRRRTEQLLEADAARRRRSWFWVHHNPPDNTPVCWTGKKFGGDPDLVRWIERHQPDLVFSGHIHNAPFYAEGSWHCRIGNTVVFNPGKQIGPEPTHILIDTATATARWRSTEGEETINWGPNSSCQADGGPASPKHGPPSPDDPPGPRIVA